MSVAELIQLLGALALLLGATGLGFWYKTRHDGRSSLSSSESQFREHILAELGKREEENRKLTKCLNDQGKEVYKYAEQVITLSNTIDRLLPISLERDLAIRRLDRCHQQAEVDRKIYENRIAELEAKVAELIRQLEELTRKVDTDEHPV